MKTISLVYLNAGGGHRAAAQAIHAALRLARPDWRVRRVDLAAVLDPNERFRAVTGFAPEELYNRRLASGFTLGLAQELKLLQALVRVAHAPMQARLARHWLETEPDLVVSLIPNVNRVLCDSVAQALPGVPFATLLTDLADLPPNFWIEPAQDQYLVCGTDRALAQARAAGYPDTRLFLTGGMVLRPDFYAPAPHDRAERRVKLGLPAKGPVGAVLFGGQGSRAMLRIARELGDLPLLLLCGHNRAVADELRRLRRPAPHAVVGFTPEVAAHLHLCDFVIGKPGPGCISEAVTLGLPVVTTRNAWTMPQERYNTEWIVEQRVGIVHRSMRTIRQAVDELLTRLPEFRANCRRIDNRAVFEVPAIVEQMLFEAALPRRHLGGYGGAAGAAFSPRRPAQAPAWPGAGA